MSLWNLSLLDLSLRDLSLRTVSVRTVVICLAALIVGSCQVSSTVEVTVEEDGSGLVEVVVVLDEDVVTRLGDPKSVRFKDLESAGWKVSGPTKDDSGDVRFNARRAFRSSEELAVILGDLGASGVESPPTMISGVKLVVKDSFARTEYSFRARVVTGDPGAMLSDAELAKQLGGLPLGRTPEELAAEGLSSKGFGTITLKVDLPGSIDSHDGAERNGAVEWTIPIGSDKPLDRTIRARSEVTQRRVWVLLFASAGALGLAGALVAVGVVRRCR